MGGPDDQAVVDARNRSNRRRALAIGRPPEQLTAETPALLEKFEYRRSSTGVHRCYLHGTELPTSADGTLDWHLEHVDPLVLGGGHTLANLEVACRECNLAKGSKTLEAFLGAADALAMRRWLDENKIAPLSLRERPVADLWDADSDPLSEGAGGLARRWAPRPRPDPDEPGGVAKWRSLRGEPQSVEGAASHDLVLQVLLDQNDPRAAMTTKEICDASPKFLQGGSPHTRSALDRAWAICFGMSGDGRSSPSAGYWDQKFKPSPWLVAVNLPKGPGRPSVHGFRLRWGVGLEPNQSPASRLRHRIVGADPTDSRYPDLDGHLLTGGEVAPRLER